MNLKEGRGKEMLKKCKRHKGKSKREFKLLKGPRRKESGER